MNTTSRVQIVNGVSGVALPSGQKTIVWSRPMCIEGLILFAGSGLAAQSAGLQIEILDEDAQTIFSNGDGTTFVPALLFCGLGPSIHFPGEPRWFPLRRDVEPGDAWKVHVTGGAGVVPIVAFRTRARDASMFDSRVA